MYARKLCILVASLGLVVPAVTTLVGCDEGQKSGQVSGNTGPDEADRNHNASGTGQAVGNPSNVTPTTAPTTENEGVDVRDQGK